MKTHPRSITEVADARPWLESVNPDDLQALQKSLNEEESRERERDADYWQPLKQEMEQTRDERRRSS